MSRTLVWTVVPLALAASALTAPAADDKPAKEKTPPVLPIEARLVANKDTYTLDLGGVAAEDYRKQLKDSETAGKLPVPKVDLALELVNTSDKDVQIRVGGTQNVISLDLKGPGAEAVSFRNRPQPRFLIASKTVTLAPGKSEKVPITSLAHGLRGLTDALYWTAPGEYTLTARYQTALNPAPDGTNTFGAVTLTSAPIKLKVVEGK